MEGKEAKFARVVIPSPLKESLVYSIPSSLQERLSTGMRVLVPLGSRKVAGVVVDFLSQTSLKEVRGILGLLDERPILDLSLLKLIYWVSQYYVSSMGEVLATILPPSLRREGQRIIFLQPGEFRLDREQERKILAEVKKRRGRVAIKTLARRFQGGSLYQALDRLAIVGAIEIRDRQVQRRVKKITEPGNGNGIEGPLLDYRAFSLSPEQQGALHAIQNQLEKGGFQTFLLYGVTGSGKTEVYLRAMEEARRVRKRSLILVPEISLTPQLLDRLRERFPKKIGVLHSALTPSERWAQWWDILNGKVDVVVGARSAVFAPVPDLGLIIVDEEHDSSYKQEEGLRYHARDLAVVRGKLLGCPVLLGSATPAIESFQNCRQGRYRLLELTHRVEQRPLPSVEVIDLKSIQDAKLESSNSKLVTPFSLPLLEALRENYIRGQQSLIFLNRRGYANFLQCRLCGFVLRCTHCSVTMTFHLNQKSLFCHHCGLQKPATDLCPGCGHLTLSGIGFGTEQVERELSRLIPEARIARMDRDTTSKRGSQERLIRQWEKGETDILVGTQMITKGHDVTRVTLVGVIRADHSLNLPDFRATERTFQLLSQVAGRAGRGKEPGRVIIQTYTPDHCAFQYVRSHDYKGFFSAEIEFRRVLNYPPFSRLVHLRLEGHKAEEVEAKAKTLGERLREKQKRNPRTLGQIEILGPAPAPIEKLRSRYRWQILLKAKKNPPLLDLAEEAREIIPRSRSIRLHIDVDPHNML
jgi:primosomal protein N' (replication factor Y)